MVRTVVVAFFVLLLAVPAFAQDDYPRVEMAMGYTNLGFPSFTTANSTDHHSGFATHMGFNLSRNLGFENYTGVYGMGQGVTLISNLFGGKAMYRGARVVPFVVAGLGVGYFTASSQGYVSSASTFATRYGFGADIPFNDSMGWKIDVSRLGMGNPFTESRTTNWNISTGIVFTLSN
jgi:hypothetical protein